MTTKLSRRRFIPAAGLGAMGLYGAANSSPLSATKRKFYAILSLGRIGFKGSFQQSVDLATKYGFEGIDPDPEYFARLSDGQLERLVGDLESKKLRLGAAGLPVEFRKDEQTFSEDLKKLPGTAKGLARARVVRVSTWVLPFSAELTYLQNFRTHACRLRACAQVLQDHGQRLGLEYVAPQTMLRSSRHPFVHTMSEMKELLVAVGTDNLGLQLDSWHWFNARETQRDLLTLRGEDVLTVDLNDAPSGVSMDELQDDRRELPAATGVIPIKDFLDGLQKIGYDGPVQAEPFNAALAAMPVEQACAATRKALGKALSLAGLT